MSRGIKQAKQNESQMIANRRLMATMSALIDRKLLASDLGQSFNGSRDMYDTLGYPIEISFNQYYARYKRQDVAGRVVDLPAIDTWRKPPVIIDDGTRTDDDETGTPFVQALRQLANKMRVWHYLQRIDRLSGIGRFGVLLIGARGSMELATELAGGSMRSIDDVLYLSPYSEASVTINAFVTDEKNERFGMPDSYKIQISSGR